MACSRHFKEELHFFGTISHCKLQVTLCHFCRSTDGVKHFLTHLCASFLALQFELLDGIVGLLLKLRDFSRQLVIHEPACIFVHFRATLFHQLCTLLTCLNGLPNGCLQLAFVRLLHRSDHLAPLSRLELVLPYNSCQFFDLLVGLAVIFRDHSCQAFDFLVEIPLHLAHLVDLIQTHAPNVCRHLSILLGLRVLCFVQGSPHSACRFLQLSLSMFTIACELLFHLSKCIVEAHGQLIQLVVRFSLVLCNEALKLT